MTQSHAVLRRSERRRCDVCGGRYISRGLREFAPACPRSMARRRDLDIPLARQYWGALCDVVAVYARTVALWMDGRIPMPDLPRWRALLPLGRLARRRP